MPKKIITRKEFQEVLDESAIQMAEDKELQRSAKDLLARADKHKWIHQTTWMGEPILNMPQDMFAIQEIIYQTKPDFIIEVGTAWGGGLLFYSSLLEIIGGKKVIGIDIFIPEDLKERISKHQKLANRIKWVLGSSIDEHTIRKVKDIIGNSKRTLVILDSYHSHAHVLKELFLFQEFVGKGHYLICGDTIVEYIPEQKHRKREWGHGNNPKTALDEFLATNRRFVADKNIENKLLLTCNPGGFLRAIED